MFSVRLNFLFLRELISRNSSLFFARIQQSKAYCCFARRHAAYQLAPARVFLCCWQQASSAALTISLTLSSTSKRSSSRIISFMSNNSGKAFKGLNQESLIIKTSPHSSPLVSLNLLPQPYPSSFPSSKATIDHLSKISFRQSFIYLPSHILSFLHPAGTGISLLRIPTTPSEVAITAWRRFSAISDKSQDNIRNECKHLKYHPTLQQSHISDSLFDFDQLIYGQQQSLNIEGQNQSILMIKPSPHSAPLVSLKLLPQPYPSSFPSSKPTIDHSSKILFRFSLICFPSSSLSLLHPAGTGISRSKMATSPRGVSTDALKSISDKSQDISKLPSSRHLKYEHTKQQSHIFMERLTHQLIPVIPLPMNGTRLLSPQQHLSSRTELKQISQFVQVEGFVQLPPDLRGSFVERCLQKGRNVFSLQDSLGEESEQLLDQVVALLGEKLLLLGQLLSFGQESGQFQDSIVVISVLSVQIRQILQLSMRLLTLTTYQKSSRDFLQLSLNRAVSLMRQACLFSGERGVFFRNTRSIYSQKNGFRYWQTCSKSSSHTESVVVFASFSQFWLRERLLNSSQDLKFLTEQIQSSGIFSLRLSIRFQLFRASVLRMVVENRILFWMLELNSNSENVGRWSSERSDSQRQSYTSSSKFSF